MTRNQWSLMPAEQWQPLKEILRSLSKDVWQWFRQFGNSVHILRGYHFEVVTDHSSLRWLSNLKDPTGRLGMWATELLGNQVPIKRRKGASHHVPDALSRMYETETKVVSAVTEKDDPWYLRRIKNVQEMPAHSVLSSAEYLFRFDLARPWGLENGFALGA